MADERAAKMVVQKVAGLVARLAGALAVLTVGRRAGPMAVASVVRSAGQKAARTADPKAMCWVVQMEQLSAAMMGTLRVVSWGRKMAEPRDGHWAGPREERKVGWKAGS